MNKYLKALVLDAILCISLIFIFQNNISYCQNNSIDMLISIKNEEEYLNMRIKDLDYILKNKKQYKISSNDIKNVSLVKKISIDSLKYSQIKFFKMYFDKQLIDCKKNESLLINKIKEETIEALQNTGNTYLKGRWPIENYRYISSAYGYRIHPITKKISFHNGIDIPAPKNTSVLASDDGIVIFVGYKNGYGNVVEIEHFDSKKTLYAHNNNIVVNKGQVVKKGQVIAKVGSTGNSTGNHIHFEVKINNERINPIYGISNSI